MQRVLARPSRYRRPKAARCAALFAALTALAGTGGCASTDADRQHSGSPAPDHTTSYLSAPGSFYLRPHGDKAGPADKVPFHVQAEDVKADSRTDTEDHRLTVEVNGAHGAVQLKIVGMHKSGPRCAGDATRVVCRVSGAYDSWADLDRVYPVAAEGGEPGDKATVTFRFGPRDGKALTARTRVVVGEPVLEMRESKPLADVEPGSEVGVALAVRNTGEVPVKGVGLQLGADALDFRQRYANCRYPSVHDGHTAVCRFPDLRIAPGATVVIRPELRLRSSRTLMYGSLSQAAWPLDVGPKKYATVPDGGDPGNGPQLTAVTSKSADGTFTDETVDTEVRLDTHADAQVFGASLRGSPGTEKTVRLKVRNNGPGDPGTDVKLLFTPPPGATVKKQPMEAIDEDAYEPYCENHDGTYSCSVHVPGPGKTSDPLDFTLRLGGPGSGSVRIERTDGDADLRDPDASNDRAGVTVRP